MEFNRASAANNVTPSPEKEENVAGIQISGGRISDSAVGETSRQGFQTAIDTSGGNEGRSPKKLEESAGIQLASGQIPDSIDESHQREILAWGPSSSAKPKRSTRTVVAGSGAYCHQCRQGNRIYVVACNNQKKNKPCCLKICHPCLRNRYGEDPAEVGALADWNCPKCRRICNCSICSSPKRNGQEPAGVPHKKAKKTNEKKPKNSRSEGTENDNKEKEIEEEGADIYADIPLPAATELRSVAGLDVPAEDVGNALQLLEFCSAFKEILDLKRAEAENILRELLHGGTASGALTVRFHVHLLSLLEESATLRPSDGENSWFPRLKNCFSEAQSLLKSLEVDSLLSAADYESLSASEKLKVLILLCDEVLGTRKARNWIEKENNEHLERVREAKQKIRAAKCKEESLQQKMKDDVRKAISAKDGAPLSISEHEEIVSHTKSEAAEVHAEVLQLENIVRKGNKTCDALRTEPLLMEHHGNAYWKLNSSDKSYVLQQNIGKGDTFSLDEKWYFLDDAGTEIIKKHVSSRRKKFRKQRAPKASSSQPQSESVACVSSA